MKKLLLITLAFTLSYAVNAQLEMPQPSPFTKIEQRVGLTDITLEYSRPAVRGRTIFGDLVPYGKTWRTGANDNTKITFSTSASIEGKELKAGTYAIYTIPNKDSWEIIFYSDASNWGTPQKWDDAKVVAKITANADLKPLKIESFTMSFSDVMSDSAVLEILWENVSVTLSFQVPTDKIVTASIDKIMNGPSANNYFASAVYYLNAGKDIAKAKEWIDKSIAMNKEPRFWQLRQQSLIYAASGDKKGAIEIAKKSLTASEKAGNDDYVKMNKDSLKEWGAM